MDFQRITLIGSGKVATQLGFQLHHLGKTIPEVYSPNLKHAQSLASQIEAVAISDLSNLSPQADLYIIAVSDNAIETVIKTIKINCKTVVHTAGSIPLQILESLSPNHGVLYPLQTFTKEKTVDFSRIPFCIEASNRITRSSLLNFAGQLSDDVRYISTQQRLLLHVAAVFVSNFSNLMYLMGEELLQTAGLPFDILNPLIEETAAKIGGILPHRAQTGPAVRNDEITIQKHLDLLKDFPDKQEIYKLLSEKIIRHFNKYNK
jgi:predicted short-subunit dehydrogenase-like oxidoreductase (DUF2520 family)